MNLDVASAMTTTAPLAPSDWSMDVQVEGSQFTAVVMQSGSVMCRLSVVCPDGDEAAARSKLADMARLWIHEYLSRAEDA